MGDNLLLKKTQFVVFIVAWILPIYMSFGLFYFIIFGCFAPAHAIAPAPFSPNAHVGVVGVARCVPLTSYTMESHSMRRRQTVLGEQLQAAANSSHSLPSISNVSQKSGSNSSLMVPGTNGPASTSGTSLGVPSGGAGVRSHMRSFSRLSARYDGDSQLSLDSRDMPTGRVPRIGGSANNLSNGGGAGSTSLASGASSVSGVNAVVNAAAAGGSGDATPSGVVGLDLMDKQLINGPIDPLSYLSRNLAGADAAAVLEFGEKLRAQAQKVQESEHKSVQRNYKALRAVANGVSELPVAVAELDRQMGELSAVTEAMRQDAAAQAAQRSNTPGGVGSGVGSGVGGMSASGLNGNRISNGRASLGIDGGVEGDDGGEYDSATRVGVRQSMMVLNNTWMKDLNSLYQRVRGAQKVLPLAPGRHLVMEESGWLLLNLVTQRAVKPVLLVLLNDYFMVAAPQHGRYVHDSHFALDQQLHCEIDEVSRVLLIKSGTQAQLSLLAPSISRLRVVYHELTKLNELTVVSKQRLPRRTRASAAHDLQGGEGSGTQAVGRSTSKSGSQSTQRASHGRTSFQSHSRNLSGHSRSQSGFGHSRKVSTSSVSSIQEATIEERREASRVVANIDREIAHRRFSEAVDLVVSHDGDPVYGAAVAVRHQSLVETLLGELRMSWQRNSRQETSALIKMLVRLGNEGEAKQTLLDTAAQDIENQARMVTFLGDVVSYISQMAAIYFQTIIATLKVYQMAFPSKADSSRITTWVKSQVDIYAAIFNRQLYRISPEFKAYQRCREVSRLESSQLKAHRMDMEFMLRYVWEN